MPAWAALLRGRPGAEPQAWELLHAAALLPRLLLPACQQHPLRLRRLSSGALLPYSSPHRNRVPRTLHVWALSRQHRAHRMSCRCVQSLGRPMELHRLPGGRGLSAQSHAAAYPVPLRLRVQQPRYGPGAELVPSRAHVRRGRGHSHRAAALRAEDLRHPRGYQLEQRTGEDLRLWHRPAVRGISEVADRPSGCRTLRLDARPARERHAGGARRLLLVAGALADHLRRDRRGLQGQERHALRPELLPLVQLHPEPNCGGARKGSLRPRLRRPYAPQHHG
mmetsp:Transcript_75106/g.179284  ORF Transcript_75106/g.179284 Transcript_75106/m.179284 type:complete len:279 (+) Transcript_75106:4330-5166(+)